MLRARAADADAVQGVHHHRGRGFGHQHLDIDGARAPRARQPNAKPADLPGYYLKNAVLTDFDIAGNPSVRIEAERIDQIAHGNEVALYNVRVNYQSPGGENWVMVGDVAHVQPGGTVVDVSGNVRLQGEAGAPGNETPAVLHTDTLRYAVPDGVASTKDDVRVDFADHASRRAVWSQI
jgi:LPS export ABC transporter protein LptC